MTALLGWTIIIVVFYGVSLALLWPALRRIRRSSPTSKRWRWVYAAAPAVLGLALWHLIPLAVFFLFGRTSR